jgi:hypothetical protein
MKMKVRKNRIYALFSSVYILLNGWNHAQVVDSLSKISSHSQQILLDSYVEESKVPLNRTVILHVELSWKGELNRYQIEPVNQPILTNLLLDGSGSENRLEPQENGTFKAVKAITYRFRPLEMGMAYIDGLLVKYREKGSDLEESLSSQRIMIEIIDPIPEAGEGKVKSIIYIVLLIIFFIIVSYFLVVYFRKRREAKNGITPVISPSEFYLNRMVQEVDPRGTNLNEMINRLSHIFREYLQEEFNFPVLELSTREVLEQVNRLEMEDADKSQLSRVLEKLDVVKFAGRGINPDEFIDIYGTIENFLLKRKQLFESAKDLQKEVK